MTATGPDSAERHHPPVSTAAEGSGDRALLAVPDRSMFGWLVRLRWLAAAGVALVLLVSGPLLAVLPRGRAPALWAVLTGLAVYNTLLQFLGSDRRLPWLTHFTCQITVDCVALALFVHLSGGVENPFLPLFVLHVVSANIVLHPRAARAVLLLAIVLVVAVVLGEGAGLLAHRCLRPNAVGCLGSTVTASSLAVLGGLVLTLAASGFFARHLTARLQNSESRLTDAVRELCGDKRRLAETRREIEAEQSRLQSVLDCMADAVTFSDLDGRLRLANRRAHEIRRIAGPLPDPILPAPSAFSVPGGEDSTLRTFQTYERGGRTFEATWAVVRDARAEPIGTVTVERDISDRLALERHLMHEERMSVVGKLAAAVAHEVNNPIGVVSLYAQHARAQLPAGHAIEGHLEVIRRNAESCRKIVGDLLGLARTRAPERKAVDLRAIGHDVGRSVEPMAARKGVRVVDECGTAEVDALWVEGDADQICQAVLNLAVNAIEACGDGDRITLRTGEENVGGSTTGIIEVRDSGPGVPVDQRDRIFQPFFSTKPDGTGLGLAVADNIARSHAGRITVEAAEPRGAVFRIHLPAVMCGAGTGHHGQAVSLGAAV